MSVDTHHADTTKQILEELEGHNVYYDSNKALFLLKNNTFQPFFHRHKKLRKSPFELSLFPSKQPPKSANKLMARGEPSRGTHLAMSRVVQKKNR